MKALPVSTLTVCDDCHAEQLAWLDYRVKPRNKFANHAAYDDTPAGMRDNRRGRYAEWRDTVNFQHALIRKLCLANPEHRQATP